MTVSTLRLPFLATAYVSGMDWRSLTPGQRDLHLLWRKKFIPLLNDHERITPTHLSDSDRRVLRKVVEGIARQEVVFTPALTYQALGVPTAVLVSKVLIDGEPLTLRVLVVTHAGDDGRGSRIALKIGGSRRRIEAILEWHPHDDPSRGSVVLHPDAAGSPHRFAIAAFSGRQFIAIAEAFLSYLGRGEPSWPNTGARDGRSTMSA